MEQLAIYFHFPAWDTALFLQLNAWHTPFLDGVAAWWTRWLTWIPLYAWMLYAVVKNYGRHSWLPVLLVVLCVYAGDTLGTDVLKPLFLRLRPGRTPQLEGLVHLVNGAGGRYSFVSIHAVTSFSLAFCMQCMLKHAPALKTCMWAWAILMSYSRIYTGRHYPLDLLCGALAGLALAWACCAVLRMALRMAARKTLSTAD